MNGVFGSQPLPPLARKRVLWLALGAFIFVFVLWQTESILLYPFRLLVTYVHEMGHGLAAVITGGEFISFHVYPDGSGIAFTDGGSRHLILLSGYVGTALFGSLLLFAANRVRRVRLVTTACGAFFALSALLFGGTGGWTIETAVTSFFAIMVGIIGCMVFIALARYGSRTINVLSLNTLAFIIGFNVVSDFLFLLRNQDIGVGMVTNDAAAMAQLTRMPTLTWIVIWAAASLIMMGAASIFAFVEPERNSDPSWEIR